MLHGNKDKYLTPEYIDKLNLSGKDIACLLPNLSVEQKNALSHFNEKKTLNAIVLADESIRAKMIDILEKLDNSNSGELVRVKEEMAVELMQLNPKKYDEIFKEIENIYLTGNVPNVAKRFLVFQKLHPEFLGENIKGLRDRSRGNIPSLNKASARNRKIKIFSQLLKCSIQSNDRDLQGYMEAIEKGNMLFELAINSGIDLESFEEDQIGLLTRYRNILNTLYKHTSRGKKDEENKVTNDVIGDLKKLNDIMKNDRVSMPDRIVRLFCPLSGVRTLEEVKNMMQNSRQKAIEKSRKVSTGEIPVISEGDFVKGVQNTRYFNSMLENGVLAKDFLGANSDSDCTPLDTDLEKVAKIGGNLAQTLNGLKIANGFTTSSVSGKSLGSILLVFDKNDYIETRDSRSQVDEDAIKRAERDLTKDEVSHNGGQAYGAMVGTPSTRIKAIISDRYIDKMGLTVATSSPVYIPIFDKSGNLIYTEDMYNEFKENMQGLSYYGKKDFEVDETARNSKIIQVANLVDDIQENSEYKRKAILSRLNEAVQKVGCKLSDRRMLDLLPGFIEFIDTGSTGRGTNEPGDGDYDFMVKMDRAISKNSSIFKQFLKEALSKNGKIDKADQTVDGNFRFKGVHLAYLGKTPIDLDLTFSTRTNEITYSTDECVKDRLHTIRSKSEEDYKIVIANILVAKKMMKKIGAYKKSSAAPPEVGQIDTRGGLGGVGIETWILQNGGSFERAARTFVETAEKSCSLSEFQQNYPIWDFGQNHISENKDVFAHDNFVFNLNQKGYDKMLAALKEYLKMVDEQKIEQNRISIEEIVGEDTSALYDSTYMESIQFVLAKRAELDVQQKSFRS